MTDPQRGTKMSGAALEPLLATLENREVFVFTDGAEKKMPNARPGHTEIMHESGLGNPYFERWVAYYRWLRQHPEVRFVWCVDGTDVKLLGDPFHLKRDTLYLGSEPVTIGSGWLAKNHPTRLVQHLVDEKGHLPLLNAGLVGGDRDTVLEFIHDLIETWGTIRINQWHKKDEGPGLGDMGVFNVVANSPTWEERVITGPFVHTVFKAEQEKHPTAIWKHK